MGTSTSLLGTPVRSPIGVAPTTLQRAAHPDGEVAMARAVAAAGSVLVVSSNAGSTFEDIAATGRAVVAAGLRHRRAARPRSPCSRRAVAAGASAVVLTADTPVVGTKYDGTGPTVWDVVPRTGCAPTSRPDHGEAPGDEKATDLGPQDVDWLAQATGLPVVVKGVLRAGDARRCVDAGAAAIWVSNHGGRQLDYAVAHRGLPGGGGRRGRRCGAEVYVDGGVRNARHVLAALALGARGVFLGRLPLYALAVDGDGGVRRLLDELADELVEALRLAGCPAAGAVPRDLVVPVTGPDRTDRSDWFDRADRRASRRSRRSGRFGALRASDLRECGCDRGHSDPI